MLRLKFSTDSMISSCYSWWLSKPSMVTNSLVLFHQHFTQPYLSLGGVLPVLAQQWWPAVWWV